MTPQLIDILTDAAEDLSYATGLFKQRSTVLTRLQAQAKMDKNQELFNTIRPIRVFCAQFDDKGASFLDQLHNITQKYNFSIQSPPIMPLTGQLAILSEEDLTPTEQTRLKDGSLNPKHTEIASDLTIEKNFWQTHTLLIEDLLLLSSRYADHQSRLLNIYRHTQNQQLKNCTNDLLALAGSIKLMIDWGKECLGQSEARANDKKKKLTGTEHNLIRTKYLRFETRALPGKKIRVLDPKRLSSRSQSKIKRLTKKQFEQQHD